MCAYPHFQDLFKEILLVNYRSEPNKEIITNRILTDMITELLCQCPQYQDQILPKPIENICTFLQNTFREKLTLDQIAEYIGFEDHNGFYRAFSQREDMSPSAYRKYWDTF